MFFAAPFALLIGAMLISFGWGDWPETLGRYDGYLEVATTLGCLGVVLGIVAQIRRGKVGCSRTHIPVSGPLLSDAPNPM